MLPKLDQVSPLGSHSPPCFLRQSPRHWGLSLRTVRYVKAKLTAILVTTGSSQSPRGPQHRAGCRAINCNCGNEGIPGEFYTQGRQTHGDTQSQSGNFWHNLKLLAQALLLPSFAPRSPGCCPPGQGQSPSHTGGKGRFCAHHTRRW